jgi:hypothetical protein
MSANVSYPPSRRHSLSLFDRLLSASLIVLCAAVLVHLYSGSDTAGTIAASAWLAFLVTGQAHFRTRERLLMSLAAILTLAAFLLPADATALLGRALGQAAFLAAFMILLALLREGAVTSDAVLGLGRYLTRQPPGRRYTAISSGGHALGIFLNFGALSLLGPLVQRGLREDIDEADRHLIAIREQRQMSALARGFSWIIVWSPTAVTQALVSTIVVGARPGKVAAIGALVAVAVLLAGWLEDRWRGKQARARFAAEGRPPATLAQVAFPKRDFAMFSSICLALAALTVLLVLTVRVTTIHALMLVAPIVTFGWLWLQVRLLPDAVSRLRARLIDIVAVSAPRGAPEALTLSIAGYCGIVAAGLMPPEILASLVRIDTVPPLLLYLAAAFLVPVASNAALPPILTVTFIGSLYSALPEPPGDPTLLAAAFALGWALNLTASPFGATGLVLSRATGIPATTLTWRWNGLFTVIAYLICALILALAERF